MTRVCGKLNNVSRLVCKNSNPEYSGPSLYQIDYLTQCSNCGADIRSAEIIVTVDRTVEQLRWSESKLDYVALPLDRMNQLVLCPKCAMRFEPFIDRFHFPANHVTAEQEEHLEFSW